MGAWPLPSQRLEGVADWWMGGTRAVVDPSLCLPVTLGACLLGKQCGSPLVQCGLPLGGVGMSGHMASGQRLWGSGRGA